MQPSLDRARSLGSTGEHGVVMNNGTVYHGPVWIDSGVAFVLFENQPALVAWNAEAGRYVVRQSTWHDKARLLIGRLSYAAFCQANKLPDGTFRKRHVPYTLPEVVHDLVTCLNTNDEERAKSIFLNDYTVSTIS